LYLSFRMSGCFLIFLLYNILNECTAFCKTFSKLFSLRLRLAFKRALFLSSFLRNYFSQKKKLETFSRSPKYNDLPLTRQNHFTLRYNFPGLYKALKLFNLNVLFPLFVQSVEAEIVRLGASRRRRSTRSRSRSGSKLNFSRVGIDLFFKVVVEDLCYNCNVM